MHDPHNNIIDSRVFKEHYIDLGNENQQVFKKWLYYKNWIFLLITANQVEENNQKSFSFLSKGIVW